MPRRRYPNYLSHPYPSFGLYGSFYNYPYYGYPYYNDILGGNYYGDGYYGDWNGGYYDDWDDGYYGDWDGGYYGDWDGGYSDWSYEKRWFIRSQIAYIWTIQLF